MARPSDHGARVSRLIPSINYYHQSCYISISAKEVRLQSTLQRPYGATSINATATTPPLDINEMH